MANPQTPEEFKEYLDEAAAALNEGEISQQEYNDAVNDAKAGMIGYTAQLRTSTEQFKKSLLGLGSAIVKGEEGASVYNDSIKSAANAVDSFASKFGFLGKLIGGLLTAGAKYVAAVNKQADELFKNYQVLSRNGLATGMQDTFKNLQDMGYTAAEIGKMGDLMRENATVLANYGGTAASGAKELAAASKQIQTSDLGYQLQLMGMTVDDINKGMAGYMRVRQMSGDLQRQSADQIAASAADYILQQDKITKLTGISADQQNQIIQRALSEQGFAATQAALRRRAAAGDTEAGKKADYNEQMLSEIKSKFGDDAAKGFQAYVVGGMNNPDYQKFQRTFGTAADQIKSGSTDQAKTLQLMANNARETAANTEVYAQAQIANKYFTNQADILQGSGQYIKQTADEAAQAAESEQKAQRAGADADTKNLTKININQRNQTQTTDLLINKGITPVTKGMATLSTGIESATNVLGQLGGRTGRIGGSSSGSSVGGGGGAATGGAPAGAAALSKQLSAAGITNKTAQANILAQVSAESGGVPKTENLNYTPARLLATFPNQVKTIEQAKAIVAQGPEAIGNVIYGGRMGNASDEGYKYRGRGLIQLTGKDNYAKFSQLVGVDLVKNPDLANDPDIAQKIAVAYFKEAEKRGVDLKDIRQVGKAVGYQDANGQETAKRAQIAQNIEPGLDKQAAMGGVLSGPKTGYQAMLHGTEAVIPLPDGKTIPVQMSGGGSSQEQMHLLAMELEKLESLVKVVQKNNDITHRLLQKQS
jgi:predicted chitinase